MAVSNDRASYDAKHGVGSYDAAMRAMQGQGGVSGTQYGMGRSTSTTSGTGRYGGNVGGGYSATSGAGGASGMDLYGQQRSALEAAYAERDAARQAAYDAIVGGLQAGFNRGKTQANQVAGKALQEAYINRMMSERNLGQQLSSLGRSGGAAETTLLNLQNSYGRERGEHERVRADALADLRLALEQGIAQAKADLENARADDVVQRAESLMALQNQYADILSGGGGGGGSRRSGGGGSSSGSGGGSDTEPVTDGGLPAFIGRIRNSGQMMPEDYELGARSQMYPNSNREWMRYRGRGNVL